MSEVGKVFNKDVDLGDVMGVGSGDRSGRKGESSVIGGSLDGTVGNTFLTEPLWGQFVELLTEQSFVRQIARAVPMDQPTLRIPAISSGLSVYATAEGAEAKATSMQADDFLLEAKKIMAQVIASAELYEDSVQNIEKIITDDFVRAIAQAEEQAFLLGRVTKAGTAPRGGVKTTGYSASADGAIAGLTNAFNPASTYGTALTYDYGEWGTVSDMNVGASAQNVVGSPLTICDGVVTTALDEGNIIDMHGSSFYGGNAYKAIREAIYKLGLLGRQRKDLTLILNPVSANQLLQSDELMTLDKYGANATILTGEVGSLFGVKIIESSFLPSNGLTIAGTNSGTNDGIHGKGGYGVLVHTPSLLLGDLRKVQVENERIIQNDAFRTVVSERIAFGMERRSGAVVIGNMDSSIETLTSSSVFYPAGTAPGLVADKSSVTVADSGAVDGTNGDITFTLDSTSNTLMYLGSEGLPTGVTLKFDANGDVSSTAPADMAGIDQVQILTATVVSPIVQVIGGSTGNTGTGTIYFQSNDTKGGRSDVVAITVTVA